MRDYLNEYFALYEHVKHKNKLKELQQNKCIK